MQRIKSKYNFKSKSDSKVTAVCIFVYLFVTSSNRGLEKRDPNGIGLGALQNKFNIDADFRCPKQAILISLYFSPSLI